MTTTTFSASVNHADPFQRPAATPPVALADADALLVARAKRGDAASFEQLYRATIPRIYALCLRMTANELLARDLAHDAFVKAWESLDSFRGESTFLSWMHRLTVNVVLQDLRSTRRRESRVRLAEDGEAGLDAAQDDGPLDSITRLDLQAALARLSADARQVVVLHDIAGYRHDEIAALLGVAAGTVRSRLHHARRQLREWMTP
jgi:RNA polymerase sigma-70 factor (ECF subfamily)